MRTEKFEVKELSFAELTDTNGGNPIAIFIAGAILGGLVYDAYKGAYVFLSGQQVRHPEYYDGPVHSQR